MAARRWPASAPPIWAAMSRPASAEHAPLSIEPGKRVVIHVWLTLPAGSAAPHVLRHRIVFATAKHTTELLDGVRVPLNAE